MKHYKANCEEDKGTKDGWCLSCCDVPPPYPSAWTFNGYMMHTEGKDVVLVIWERNTKPYNIEVKTVKVKVTPPNE